MKTIFMQIFGYFFLLLGLVGLVLPVLQGVLFIGIGLILLGRSASWAQNILHYLKRKHPKIEAVIGRAENLADKIEQWFANCFRRI